MQKIEKDIPAKEKEVITKEEKGLKIFGLPWELAFLLGSFGLGVIAIILKVAGIF